jgi:hypothetical protein
MTKIDENNNLNNYNRSSIAWFIIYIAIGLAISFIIPFPLSLLVYLGIFFMLQSYRINKIQKEYYLSKTSNNNNNYTKSNRINRFIKSISNTLYSNLYELAGSQPLRFYCMNCGKEHNKRSCPDCGSMAVRLG